MLYPKHIGQLLYFWNYTLIEFLKEMLQDAGRICLEANADQNRLNLEFKNPKDLVTETDKKVEDFVINRIRSRYPLHAIFGEETGKSPGRSESGHATPLWVIDPIDGTTSFFHGQPFYCVSIAYQENGTTLMGGIYAPVLDQLFLAEKGKGAFLNHCPIRVSSCSRLIDSVMATGFACLRAGLKENNLPHFNRIVPKIRDIRRFGSAALDLCYVACGKVDGFWEMELNLYDIAAGVIIAREAGALVSDFSGGNRFPEKGILAANPALATLMVDQLNQRP